MKKILVIEDEPEMRRNLTTVLRLEKFHPLESENGRAGVELARKERPDLILCDVMMPGLDGYGVIAALRTAPETVSILFIFLTAKGEKPDIRAGMNLGADDYLTKPVANLPIPRSRNPRRGPVTRPGSAEFSNRSPVADRPHNGSRRCRTGPTPATSAETSWRSSPGAGRHPHTTPILWRRTKRRRE
jgi:CheY-like chemotaxis protein